MRLKTLAIATVLGAALAALPVHAKNIFDAEWSDGIGLGYYYVAENQFGGYINGFVGNELWEDHGEDYDNISYSYAKYGFGDSVLEKYKESYFINGGVTRGITEHVGLYAGVGLGYSQKFAEFYDPTHILSDDGHYNVERDDASLELNVNGGLLLYFGHFSMNVGYNTVNENAVIGIGYAWGGESDKNHQSTQ